MKNCLCEGLTEYILAPKASTHVNNCGPQPDFKLHCARQQSGTVFQLLPPKMEALVYTCASMQIFSRHEACMRCQAQINNVNI